MKILRYLQQNSAVCAYLRLTAVRLMGGDEVVRCIEGMGLRLARRGVETAADELGELRREVGFGQEGGFFLVEIAAHSLRAVATGKADFEGRLGAFGLF